MSQSEKQEPVRGRPRPNWLRALGPEEPPAEIEAENQRLQRGAVLKHDSWAATALYHGADGRQVICKFNRIYPIFGLPVRWLGWWLAGREAGVMRRLAGVAGVPADAGQIRADGRRLRHAVGHEFITGHPLTPRDRVNDDFFPALERTLRQVHEHKVAHVDLNKSENIIVDEAGRPHLIDFQIHFGLPRWWPGNSWPMKVVLRVLQRSDEYHLLKHRVRYRPDQLPQGTDLDRLRPWWIRTWRSIATPLRQARRRLLVMVGVRRGAGHARSEHNPEDAVRRRENEERATPSS